MPTTVIYSANLAASTKTGNILSGDVNEFVTQMSQVNIYQVSSATGIRVSVYADTDIAVDDKEIPFIGTTLVSSDQLVDSFVVMPGTRLAIFLRETAAASTTDVYTKVEVLPL
jgi:hypothetical protein